MKLLIQKLKESGIPFIIREHPVHKEYRMMKLRGHAHLLKNRLLEPQHVLVGDISIIKGDVSFYYYELMGGGFDCERFSLPEEVIEAIQNAKGIHK